MDHLIENEIERLTVIEEGVVGGQVDQLCIFSILMDIPGKADLLCGPGRAALTARGKLG